MFFNLFRKLFEWRNITIKEPKKSIIKNGQLKVSILKILRGRKNVGIKVWVIMYRGSSNGSHLMTLIVH